MNLKKNICLILFFGLGLLTLSGQANIKVGYSLGYTPLKSVNKIHQAYNLAKPGLVEPLKDVHWMHGIEIGARYKWDNVGFELSYNNLGREREAKGLDANDAVFDQSLTYSMRTISIALENYFGFFGYGVSLGTSKFRLQTNIPGINTSKANLTSSRSLSSSVYFLIAAEGNKTVSLTIKPYVILPWGSYDFSPLPGELEVADTSIDLSKVTPRFFGVSLIFYNGPQD